MDIAMRSGWAAWASAKEGPKAVSKAGVANRLRREKMVITVNPQEISMRFAIRMPRQSSSPKTSIEEQFCSKAKGGTSREIFRKSLRDHGPFLHPTRE
jgi:hypothetical protein